MQAVRAAGGALLIDLEFTCWEDSLRTQWADPARPAEIIEIGLAVYDAGARAVLDTFTTLARPHVNPVLSDYCIALVEGVAGLRMGTGSEMAGDEYPDARIDESAGGARTHRSPRRDDGPLRLSGADGS